jgi:DEAD/DEAH box helicase domain-containing protein
MKLINTGMGIFASVIPFKAAKGFFLSGAFGAHVACVLRRLIRVCRYYGCSPQFILCSATIANPAEHIRRLVPFHLFSAEADLEVVTNRDDGSPHGER